MAYIVDHEPTRDLCRYLTEGGDDAVRGLVEGAATKAL